MAIQWREFEIQKMLEYRAQGLTELLIADKLSLIFMRRFTRDSVNRKVRDLKRQGRIEKTTRRGMYKEDGTKREGVKHEPKHIPKPRKKRPKHNK